VLIGHKRDVISEQQVCDHEVGTTSERKTGKLKRGHPCSTPNYSCTFAFLSLFRSVMVIVSVMGEVKEQDS